MLTEEKVKILSISFARTPDEALLRYMLWKSIDPFPKIAAGLLNSADIIDYMNAASLMYPLSEPDQLKSCAYEMTLGGTYLFWDDTGKRHYFKELKKDTPIVFPKNSIVYVTTGEEFYIPDYLALRFNLVINHVHKGMLLGTGPLVNPGFHGKIMIPIHNFTRNDYTINVGERLISAEVTKLSNYISNENRTAHHVELPRVGVYIVNDSKYINADFEKYISRAIGPDGDVRNAIGKTLADVETTVRNVEDDVTQRTTKAVKDTEKAIFDVNSISTKLERKLSSLRNWSLWGGIVVAATIVALAVSVYTYHVNVVSAFNSQPDTERHIAEEYKNEMNMQRSELNSVRSELKDVLRDLKAIKNKK